MRKIALAALATLALAPPAAAQEPSIAANYAHVLVSKSDGTVSGWGGDLFGKLGSGRPLVRHAPGKVEGLPAIAQVAAHTYGFHFVARDTAGRVWSWGQNDFGQLGPRVQRNASLPGRVQGLAGVAQVAVTVEGSLALRNDGTVWVWGNGVWGQTTVPFQVQGLSAIVQVAAGQHHYFARRSDGTVWAVGWNSQNQLGVGAPSPVWDQYAMPTQVPLPPDVVEVAATILGGAARTADGKVWSWGTSSWSGMGDALPREVTGFPQPPTKLTGETLHYHAVLPDGSLWRWGNTATPAPVAGFASVRSAAAGSGEIDSAFDYLVVDTLGRMFVKSGNAYGERGTGLVGLTDSSLVTQVPAPTDFIDVRFASYCVIGVTAAGEVWAWGAEVNGSFGDATVQSHPVPRAIAGIGSVRQVAAGRNGSAALDAAGDVWVWGDNPGSLTGDGEFAPVSTPVRVPISGVKHIATGWSHLLMAKTDGTVWMTGYFLGANHEAPTQVAGLAGISRVAAGHESSFALGADGRLWVWGENAKGELGTGDLLARSAPAEVVIPGGVARLATDYKHVLAVNSAGAVYGWGDVDTRNTLGAPSDPGTIVTSPQPVAGIAGVVDVAVGTFHYLARRADGVLLSWGPEWAVVPLGRDASAATPAHVPSPVLEIDGVQAIAAANQGFFAIRVDGTVWGWGLGWASGAGSPVGDGTFVHRPRPVVVIRENGAGNLDTNDWFLDAKPGTPKTIPAAKVPSVVPVTRSLSSSGLLNIDGGVNVRVGDQAKTLGLYVTGLVPVEFLAHASAAPGAQAKVAGMKAGTLVLVNLTPAGWTVASGQLTAFTSGTGNAFLNAGGLLVNVNPATIPGARFCIGYGESATDMLKTGTIRDFLSLEGASATSLGLPCLLSGVYVDGPRSSAHGSPVPVRAVVVGQAPTGSVSFRQGFEEIAAGVAITPINSAVSDASVTYTPSAPGDYAFNARYGGNTLNAAASSEVPLRHTVRAVAASTTTRIEGPVTSEIGAEITLLAAVAGNRPGGTVQFRRNGVDQGAPVAVIDDHASLAVVGLPIGTHGFSAHYSGDSGNTPSASAALAHQVLNVQSSAVALGSSANPAPLGNAVTLVATVSGANPTGTVTLRERAEVLQSKSLAGGQASFTLSGLTAGIHVYAVDYSGDGANPRATSNAVFQQVTLNLPPAGDLDGDGIPNGVEAAEGSRPDLRDNDIFDNARFFAMQQYRDFLGREGDAGGIAFWADQLATGAQSRAQMVETYLGSAEFQGTGAPVARLYFAYFLRIPDYGGLNFWIAQFRGGSALETISNAFAGSAEFNNTYGALDNAQFVSLVYQNVLGRAPDAAGSAYWTGQMNAGMTRGQLMVQFSESPEYRALIANEVYVTMIYAGMLRREPDAGGFSFWVSYMDGGNSGLALIAPFLGSPEYRNRFLP